MSSTEIDLSPKGLTMKDMCEHIVKANFLFHKGTDNLFSAEEIFNYSPTGELFMVFEWYRYACILLQEKAIPHDSKVQ
jgi:hypothetical protein